MPGSVTKIVWPMGWARSCESQTAGSIAVQSTGLAPKTAVKVTKMPRIRLQPFRAPFQGRMRMWGGSTSGSRANSGFR